MIEKAWNEFSKHGWKYGECPNTREAFEAGFKAAMLEKRHQAIDKILENFRGTTLKTSEEVARIINEWNDKFDAEQIKELNKDGTFTREGYMRRLKAGKK